jgi:hypothetical protein
VDNGILLSKVEKLSDISEPVEQAEVSDAETV